MHELGIVLHVMKTLEELAPEHKITTIGSVTLEIGEVSGIMYEQFTDCWNYFRKKHPLLEKSVTAGPVHTAGVPRPGW